MKARLCIIAVEDTRVQCYLIPENDSAIGRKVVWPEKHRFPKDLVLQSGQVYNVDYRSLFLSVEGLTKDRLFTVSKTAVQEVVYTDYEVAGSQEQADEKYTKSITDRNSQTETIKRSQCDVQKIDF